MTALCVGGALDQSTLLRVARRRGELMAQASARTPGAMTAVALPAIRARQFLGSRHPRVVLANENSPRQVVLSGPTEAVAVVEQELASERISCKRLPVGTAFHTDLVQAAVQPFREFLGTVPVRSPQWPVYSCTTAQPYPQDRNAQLDLLARQLARPVRFQSIIESLHERGVRTFIEVGPGNVLTGLAAECLGARPHLAVALDRRQMHGVTGLWLLLARLAVQGVPLRWQAFWEGYRMPDPPQTDVRNPHVVMINGVNLQSPSPPSQPESIPMVPFRSPSANGFHHSQVSPAPTSPSRAEEKKPASTASTPASVASRSESPAHSASPSGDWLDVVREVLRETAAAHQSTQQALVQSCQSFFASVEQTVREAALALRGGDPPKVAMRMSAAQPASQLAEMLAPTSPPPATPAPVPPVVTEVCGEPVSPAPTLLGRSTQNVTSEVPEQAPVDLEKLVLEVVSEKTGYATDLLSLDMEIEAGLGIDSIKRVEILSTLADKIPGLPPLEPAQMTAVQTLADVVAVLKQAGCREVASTPEDQGPLPVRSVVQLTERPGSGFVMPGLFDCGSLVIVTAAGADPDSPEQQTALVLAQLLRDHGLQAEVTSTVPPGVGGVLFLGGLRPVATIEEALAIQAEALQAARQFAGLGGLFVTVQDTGADFGLSGASGPRCWLAGLPALVKTAALEWPQVAVKAIDLQTAGLSPAEQANLLLRELLEGGSEVEAAVRADSRWVPQMVPASLPSEGPVVLSPDAVVVVSGGARGVTAAALCGLVQRCRRPRLVLLGRTTLQPEPAWCRGIEEESALQRVLLDRAGAAGASTTLDEVRRRVKDIRSCREIEANLARMRQLGAEVRYLALDLQDSAAVCRELERVRQEWGPIRGLIHGAGVLADKLLKDKTPEQFQHVFGAKVLGLRNLLSATTDDPLELLCLFSSMAAQQGNRGQADYSMANETLNKVAVAEQRRRGPSCLVRSLNWGPWDGGMVTPALRVHFESQGVPLLPQAVGGRLFAAECTAGPGIEVVLGTGEPPDRARHTRRADAGSHRNQRLELDVLVGLDRQPFLASHCIDGVPVLPVVLVLEWFLRGPAGPAGTEYPGLSKPQSAGWCHTGQ